MMRDPVISEQPPEFLVLRSPILRGAAESVGEDAVFVGAEDEQGRCDEPDEVGCHAAQLPYILNTALLSELETGFILDPPPELAKLVLIVRLSGVTVLSVNLVSWVLLGFHFPIFMKQRIEYRACLRWVVLRSIGHAAHVHSRVVGPHPLGEEVAVPGDPLGPRGAAGQHDGGGLQQLEVLRQGLDHSLEDVTAEEVVSASLLVRGQYIAAKGNFYR